MAVFFLRNKPRWCVLAGSVIGSVVGFTAIVLALVCCWRGCRKNRAVKGERCSIGSAMSKLKSA